METQALIVAVLGSGVLSTLITQLFSLYNSKKQNNDGIREGIRLVLKDRLRTLCEDYIAQGWIYFDELQDIMTMHTCYHTALGGNGYLDTLMDKVKKLEVRGLEK